MQNLTVFRAIAITAFTAALIPLASCDRIFPPTKDQASAQSASAVTKVALCSLDEPAYSRHMNPAAGYFDDNVLAIPQGDNAIRVEGSFLKFEADPHWEPTFAVMLKTQTGAHYNLRYSKENQDTLLRVFTQAGPDQDNIETEYVFDENPPIFTPFKADISWTPDGTITTTVYTGKTGFDGPGESHIYKAAVPVSAHVLGSTAEIDIKALSFGKTCAANATAPSQDALMSSSDNAESAETAAITPPAAKAKSSPANKPATALAPAATSSSSANASSN